MPNINLIAVRREEKKRLERLTRQLFFGLAGSVGVFALLSLYLGARQLQMRSELADADQKMQKLQPILDRIDQIEKDTNDLLPKVETLQSAKANTLRWRALLQVVSTSIPENTWLSAFNASGSSEDTWISLIGISNSQSQVGETMTRLGTHPMFDNVELSYTNSDGAPQPGDTGQKVNFEIKTHLRNIKPGEDTATKDGEAKPGEAKPGEPQKSASAVVGGKTNG
jgi:Tfp pilus assembly protein PilN